MKIRLFLLSFLLVGFCCAQKQKPKNYRKFDKKMFHFGFMLGANNSSYRLIPKLDAYSQYGLIRIDVNSQPGAQLGIISTMKLGTPMIRLRFLPSLSFQERVIHQVFEDVEDPENERVNEERIQATSLDFPLMFQFRTLRLNNFAAYCLIGGQYSLDLQSQQDATQQFDDPFIKMKRHDFLGQIGGGIEFFAPYFKFGIEIKYSHSFINGFIQDNTSSSSPIDKIYNRGWVFSITFEG